MITKKLIMLTTIIMLAALLFSCSMSNPLDGDGNSRIVGSNYVVRIMAYYNVFDGQAIATGSGVIFETNNQYSRILSCAHVFSETLFSISYIEIDVFTSGMNDYFTYEVSPYAVLTKDTWYNLALVQLDIGGLPTVELRSLEAPPVQIGDEITMIGCGGGFTPYASSGSIIDMDPMYPDEWVSNAQLTFGFSGGAAILDGEGTLIGIPRAVSQDFSRSYFVPYKTIHHFLNEYEESLND